MARKRVTQLSAAVDRKLYIVGKTRSDLAGEIGITYQYLSNILSGRTPLSIGMSRKISKQIQMKDEELRRLAIQDEYLT